MELVGLLVSFLNIRKFPRILNYQRKMLLLHVQKGHFPPNKNTLSTEILVFFHFEVFVFFPR